MSRKSARSLTAASAKPASSEAMSCQSAELRLERRYSDICPPTLYISLNKFTPPERFAPAARPVPGRAREKALTQL